MFQTILNYLCLIPAVLFSLSFHEFAHAFVANKLGDTTAKDCGRLTLNPLKHLDLFGFICMLIFHVGWAKPVPINPRRFKNPKTGMALSALAGPVANLLTALVSCFLFSLVTKYLHVTEYEGLIYYPKDATWEVAVYLILYGFFSLNLILAVFNLLPIPPFDGSRIILLFLPERIFFSIMKYERTIMLCFFGFYLVTDLIYDYTGLNLNFISIGISWITTALEKGMMELVSSLPI